MHLWLPPISTTYFSLLGIFAVVTISKCNQKPWDSSATSSTASQRLRAGLGSTEQVSSHSSHLLALGKCVASVVSEDLRCLNKLMRPPPQ